MNDADLSSAYSAYVGEHLVPLQENLKRALSRWHHGDWWVDETQEGDVTIPSPVQRTYSRIKRVESAADKLKRKGIDTTGDPLGCLKQLNDMLGARVITYVTNNLALIDRAIARTPEFRVSPNVRPKCYLDRDIATRLNFTEDRFDFPDKKASGYGSVHYQLEYIDPDGKTSPSFELQVRTMLSEAWAEIEHKFAYKPAMYPEIGVRRQLRIVSDHLRAVDRQFDLIHDRLQYLRNVSDPQENDDLDEVNIARICADVEVALREEEVVPLLEILYDRGLSKVGSLRSRLKPDVVAELKREMMYNQDGRLTAFHLISTVVTLSDDPTSEEALGALHESLRQVDVSRIRFNRRQG